LSAVAAWLPSIGSVVVEGTRIALTVVEFRRLGRCRGCDGRGWRLASPVRLVPAEDVRRLVRRVCPECLGASGARAA
jgi:hypothetical protein